MIGKLTIDKASMNISYFLYTVQIINENNGRISRKDFGEKMGEFIGIPSTKGDKENRTPYNKSKLPRYFGFVDITFDGNSSYLVLTHRGKVLTKYIQDKGEDVPADQRYCILTEHRESFIDLIFESVIFDSFGKNNCGAEQSNTDIEPPKVVFKTIYELGKATAEEICYVMFGMNRGELITFNDAIEKVKYNRSIGKHDYKTENDKWNITNIVNDCKIINIFTDDNIKLLYCEKDDDVEKVYYYLSKSLSKSHREQIATISTSYKPINLFAYTDEKIITAQQWVNDAVLGRVSDNSFVFRYDDSDQEKTFCSNTGSSESFKAGIFEKALLKAYRNENKNVYIIVNGISENAFRTMMGEYAILLKRIDDYLSNEHGWSEQPVHNVNLHNYLITYSPKAKQHLVADEILLPSNLHIVGTVIMDKSDNDIQFDYEFQRCLIRTEKSGVDTNTKQVAVDETRRKQNGMNVLLYGVPGAGKSWTIEHEYCDIEACIERLVFHPDYMYSDFVGQILPVIKDDDKVRYEFMPGPFTKLLKLAYSNPDKSYYLIVEEINRGNAPAIFGEIFQLLDRMGEDEFDKAGKLLYKKGTSEYGISNANIARIVYGDEEHKVRIPANMSILGTMNTSDQNVFTLDTAFQRRWIMRMIPNSFVDHKFADKKILDTDVSWRQFCEAINEEILRRNNITSSEDKRLGAYFISASDLDMIPITGAMSEKEKILIEHSNSRFAEKVLKYLWDDAFKFSHQDTFNTRQFGSLEKIVECFMSPTNPKNERFRVFNENLRKMILDGVSPESNEVSDDNS